MRKYKSAKYIKFGTVGDSPYTQKVKNTNQRVFDGIRMNQEGPLWFIKQILNSFRSRNKK